MVQRALSFHHFYRVDIITQTTFSARPPPDALRTVDSHPCFLLCFRASKKARFHEPDAFSFVCRILQLRPRKKGMLRQSAPFYGADSENPMTPFDSNAAKRRFQSAGVCPSWFEAASPLHRSFFSLRPLLASAADIVRRALLPPMEVPSLYHTYRDFATGFPACVSFCITFFVFSANFSRFSSPKSTRILRKFATVSTEFPDPFRFSAADRTSPPRRKPCACGGRFCG